MRMRRPLLWLLTALLATAAVALAAGCGDDDAPDANPKTVLGEAAAKPIESADVSMRADANVPGFPILGSRLVVTADGPFAANGPDALPTLDWRVMLRAGGQSFPARVSAVDGGVYVEFMGQFYEAEPELLEQIGVSTEPGRPAPASLSDFGLDPDGWLTNVKVSDGEEIGGDKTQVVTGTVDKRAVLEDLLAIVDVKRLEKAGDGIEGLPEIDDESIGNVADAIDKVDVEVNVDGDGYPRRVYAKLDFTVPKTVKDTAIEDGSVKFELVLDQINETEVDVTPIPDADPLSSLFDFAGVIFGVDEPADLYRTPN
jgi:hypothetical protein